MPSITDKLKKKAKHAVKKFIANVRKPKQPWEEDPNINERLDPFFDAVIEPGFTALKESWEKDPIDMALMPAFEANETKKRNRQKHIGCLESTRVVLKQGSTDYINANYIDTPKKKKKFIATGAPMDSTCIDFWNMVLQEDVEIIVGFSILDPPYEWKKNRDGMLQPFRPHFYPQCARYFEEEVGKEVLVGNCKVEDTYAVMTTDIFPHEYEFNGKKMIVIERHLVIEQCNLPASQCETTQRLVRHFQFNWNKELVKEWNSVPMQFMQDLPESDKPIVMQCSTGGYRSAIFITCQYYLDLLELRRELIPPVEFMRLMRKQRHSFMSEYEALCFPYVAIIQYLIEKTGKDHPALEEFKKVYDHPIDGMRRV